MKESVKSPCINVCKYDDDQVCMGCHRSMDEITGWLFMTEDEKRQCLANARNRKQAHKSGQNDYEHYV